MIPLELLRKSEMYQDILAEGREEGREEGLAEGRQIVIDLLRRMTARGFPGLTLGAEIESIRDLKALEQLCLDLDQFTDAAALQHRLTELTAQHSDIES